MDSMNMPIKFFLTKLIRPTEPRGKQDSANKASDDQRIIEECRIMQKIWDEAGHAEAFNRIDTESDWQRVRAKFALSVPARDRQIAWPSHFLRIAALMVLVFGLTVVLYEVYRSSDSRNSQFIVFSAENHLKDIFLPDGSSVSLNTGSTLTYRDDYGTQTRDVVLEGEALFNVVPDAVHPFKVFIDESVIEVTGTKFSVREENGAIKVSVISGSVLLSSKDADSRKINITANQSGFLQSQSDEFGVEEGIPANNLSWKTGHLIFEETPIDSALIDIARHFRKELSIETAVNEEITAEFQNQPLHEILKELEIVAGLQFDTTRTTLIVRK
jgi:ferric-dicitrate binding protein FerR (iron transport regulator)